jgi:glucan 1,3-beta-glucosidase
MPVESLGIGGWLRSLAYAGVALLAPPALSAAAMRGAPLPRFSRLLGPTAERVRDPLTRLAGTLLVAVTLLAIVAALGLVFDPRYRDFPFAPLTASVVPFFMHGATMPRPLGRHGAAELAAAAMLALSVPYIALNEGFANWQSLWLCATLALLAFTLARVRDAQS